MDGPEQIFTNPQHERTKLFLSKILRPVLQVEVPSHTCFTRYLGTVQPHTYDTPDRKNHRILRPEGGRLQPQMSTRRTPLGQKVPSAVIALSEHTRVGP